MIRAHWETMIGCAGTGASFFSRFEHEIAALTPPNQAKGLCELCPSGIRKMAAPHGSLLTVRSWLALVVSATASLRKGQSATTHPLGSSLMWGPPASITSNTGRRSRALFLKNSARRCCLSGRSSRTTSETRSPNPRARAWPPVRRGIDPQ